METFSFDLDVMSLRSATLFSVFSSTLVRLFSMSEALAPGYDDITSTTFASKSGKFANEVFISEKIPKTANATNINAVVTGFFTADLYILIV